MANLDYSKKMPIFFCSFKAILCLNLKIALKLQNKPLFLNSPKFSIILKQYFIIHLNVLLFFKGWPYYIYKKSGF